MSYLDGIEELAFFETFEEVFGRQDWLDTSDAQNMELPTTPAFLLPYQGMASLGTVWDCPETQVQQHEVQTPPILFGEWSVPKESLELGQDERRQDDSWKAKAPVRAVRRQRRKRYVPGPYQTCQWKIVPREVPSLQLTHTNSGSFVNLHCHETL